MTRLPAAVLVGCVACAGLILLGLGAIGSRHALPGFRLAPAVREIGRPAGPLSSPAQRPSETASSSNDAGSPLLGVRLSGVVIGPDLRIAIFAVTGANSRALSEGETLNGWRLDSISAQRVVFSGPTGSVTLEPQPDAALVRPPPPAAGQPVPPAAAMADAPAQPMTVAPIAVATASAAAPAQQQGYPSDFSGYEPNSWGWGNPWDWGWPVGVSVGFGGCWNCGFRGRFFRPGFRRFGVGRSGFFQPGLGRSGFTHASFAGGLRRGARR